MLEQFLLSRLMRMTYNYSSNAKNSGRDFSDICNKKMSAMARGQYRNQFVQEMLQIYSCLQHAVNFM